jgi:hypothetical protein
MASRNDVTGDKIQTKGMLSKQGEDNFDAIFRKNKVADVETTACEPVEPTPLCDICGKSLNGTKECAWTGCPLNWDESRLDTIGQNGNEGLHYNE